MGPANDATPPPSSRGQTAGHGARESGRPLEAEVLDRTIFGANLEGETIREELSGGPTLLVFLRHLG